MNSSSRLVRPRPATACQLCDFILRQPACLRRPLSSAVLADSARPRPRSQIPQGPRTLPRKAASGHTSYSLSASIARFVSTDNASYVTSASDAAAEVGKAQEAVSAILSSESVPSEDALLDALKACKRAAARLTGHGNKKGKGKNRSGENSTPTSVLLDLDPQPASPSKPIDLLSSLLYNLMRHPTVFISPKVLDAYITTQSMLGRPSSFPEVLHLYANKPVPTPNTSPVKYREPSPNSPNAAVPSEVANRALDAALHAKDLHLALSIVELTFRQPAYRRALIVRKIMPPAAGLALAPGAAYVLASKFAEYQQVVNPQTATQMALAGMLAYVGAVSTIGVVALTTANDQMDRVTWAMGMALTERYLREEERAAVDRVAQAWGFKDPVKKGDEEGEEWEELREWVGLRGMVLDKVELMQGME